MTNLLAVISWCLAISGAAGNVLDISDIRLVNGSGPYGGRVEIQIHGIWGTVCDDSFDFIDANVMCRMMNLKASTYMTGASYGQGIGPIFAQEFKCDGNERHLKECSYVSNVNCTHARDIGIICSECPQIDIGHGNAVDISLEGNVLSAMCNDGFASNALTSNCSNGIWSPPSIRCIYDITDIRLVNGTGLYDGRVELLVNGIWGTICSTSFGYTEVLALCRIIFGSKRTRINYRKYYTTSTYYGPGYGPIYIDKLDCDASATSISECSYSLDVSCTDHTHDVAIACQVLPLNITDTRLVNGTGPYDGRIELLVNGYWGTICNRYINMFDAQTICNTHNASLAAYFTTTVYGKGTGQSLIGDIICYSAKDHINDCYVYLPYRPSCTNDNDLSIVCTPCGLPKIYNGEVFSFNDTVLTVKCQSGFFPDFIKLRCLDNGTWAEDQRCTSYRAYPLNISEIRLNNSNGYSHEGRLELYVNGTWGTVCGTKFNREAAAVVCRMFGLEYKGFYTSRGDGTIFVDKLSCNGTEKHINNCTYEISNYCTHYDDVAVTCTGYQLNITNIKLAGTNGSYHGRVEIEVDGTWGTVCDNNLHWSEAKVLCRMLGLEYKDYYKNAMYGPGSGPIYFNRLYCPYGATHINECKYGVNNYLNCDHGDDASVLCYGPRLNITDVRLVNGTGPYDGRAEIKVSDTWGTICDDNFDILDADYFCRKLGLRAVQFYTGAFYGEGSGPVFIDQLFCNEHDDDLSNCKYVFLNECTHERDVSVVCNECGQTDTFSWYAGSLTYNGTTLYGDCSYYKTYLGTLELTCNGDTQKWVMERQCQKYDYPLKITGIRLADGPHPSQGRVEIKSLNTWGTICDDNFEIAEANLICRMVGYTRALRFHTGAFYGKGKGPIFADDLDCKDNAFDLNDCTYKTYDDCSHWDDISVVCTDCGDPTPENGFVNTSSTTYQTVVHVTCDKDYKLIGEENIICQANGKWSNQPVCKILDITNIRLVNGIGLYDGRVELLLNGTWGTICSTSFEYTDAVALCRIIFGSKHTRINYRKYYTTSTYYGPGYGPIYIDKLDCDASATSISECSYSLDVSCTDHTHDVAIACQVLPLNITDSRLVNGTGPYDGRIEFFVNGYWGTICNRYIDMFAAQTICNTHNASLAAYFTTTAYGKGTGPGLIDYIICYSAQDHINDCSVYLPYRPSCTNDYDLSVVCTPCGLPKIYNGEAFSFNNTELTVKCQSGFFPDFIKLRCLDNGTWAEDQRCTSYHEQSNNMNNRPQTEAFQYKQDYPLNISEIRLNNSNGYSHEGRVELFVNGTWGTMCDTKFDREAAVVVCRMFGLEYERFHTNTFLFGKGEGTIFVDKLSCNGTEKHINNCTYEISNYCTHYDDVAVTCTGYQLNITDIKLAGTNGSYHGRVEIEVDGTWGTVCGNNLYWSEAKLLCRMIGLEYKDYYKNAMYGPGSGPIYLNRLDCPYWATHINECKYGVDNYFNCDHGDDASVMCYGPRLNITDTRLVNGTGPYDGRAEIKVSDTWGTICDDDFDILDADYFCRKLGLRAVQFYTGAFYGEGSGPVFIDQLFCNEHDDDLSNCKYLFLNECTHERDVSVVCNECGQTDILSWYAGPLTYNGTMLYGDCTYYKTYLGTLKLTCNGDTQTWVMEGHCQKYSYPLNITDIRLADGPRPSQGRVEIKSLNTWGTICDDNFEIAEANLICRMVGYTRALRFHTGAFYGKGKGPIFADDLDCKDNALDLNDCTYKTYDDCSHWDDISVVCTDCGDPTPENGFVNTSSTTYQTVVRVTCDKDYELIGEENIICQANRTWSNQPVCKLIDITNIRLVNGIGLYDGRVELLVNGIWGTICSTSFEYTDAVALCRIIFGSKHRRISYRNYYTTSTYYGPGYGPIYIDKLDCDASATSISKCSYSLDVSCTDHTHDVAIACQVLPLNITDTRLVNGTGPYDGRIELFVSGYWGTICNRYIDMFAAQTICNTHNASLAAYFTTTAHGKGTGPGLIDDIICYSAQDHINDCYVYLPYRPSCTNDYDLSVVCTPCGLPKIYNGEAFSFNDTELTVKCQSGFFPDFINLRCLDNGTWAEDQRCTSYHEQSNNMNNRPQTEAFQYKQAYPLNISEIRLNNSYGYSHEGRVEVFVNGTWGTVCGTKFDREAAAVVCRMFGLKYESFHTSAFHFGRGEGTIFVDKLSCNGTEKHINNCTYEISNYCTHYDDVAVTCTGYQLNITNIKLAGTNGSYHGRVEIEVDGTWGTVCGNNLYWSEAKVLCRMLGLEYKVYYKNAMYGPGSGPIYFNRLDCPYGATHINECKYGVNNYFNCDHGDDASVMCYGPRLNITDVRLVNGTGPYDGRAEIKVSDTWGTICDDNFDILDADYFCRKLGLRAVQFYTGAFYGEGSGPVFIDQLFCNEHDDDLSDCKYLFLNECTHERDVSVVCNECGQTDTFSLYAGSLTYNGTTLYGDCSYYKTYLGTLKLTCNGDTQTWVLERQCQQYIYPLDITDIRLADGPQPSQGRVEIKSLNTWGTICDDNFELSEANLICRMVGYTRALRFHTGAFYGKGKGPIFADGIDCKDNALDLNDCTYNTYNDCTHWDDISVVCTDCGDPTPDNGFVNTSSTTYQTVVHVTCDKGYKLIGEENSICQANRTWSNQPVCKLIDCGDPTPEHGLSNNSDTTNGTVSLIECETGYTVTGESIIICQQNETWTDTPSCVIKGEEVDDDSDKLTIILTVCIGILVVAIIGLVTVKAFRKRNSNPRTVFESTTATGTEAETYHNNDDASNIQQASTSLASGKTNLNDECIREMVQLISMKQLDYDKPTPTETMSET